MIQYGCLARYFNRYEDEIQFAKNNGFDFMQMWYDNKGFWINNQRNEDVANIAKFDFPAIIHGGGGGQAGAEHPCRLPARCLVAHRDHRVLRRHTPADHADQQRGPAEFRVCAAAGHLAAAVRSGAARAAGLGGDQRDRGLGSRRGGAVIVSGSEEARRG